MEPVNCTNSELCTYLQALAAGYWPICSRDSRPSARSKKIYIASRSFRRGKKTVHFPGFQFLMMFRHLMAYRGAGLLSLSLADSHVKTSASRDAGQELKGKNQVYGEKWRELSVKFDRVSCSWKTHRQLFIEDLSESSVTCPQWGMIRDGVLLERITSGLHIIESAHGYWLTPTRLMSTESPESFQKRQRRKGYRNGTKVPSLAAQVNNPKYWPTPTAHNAKETAAPSEARRNTPTLASQAGGKLNPDWVEWLMGWPIGWTDLKPLATDKFQRWLNLHGRY